MRRSDTSPTAAARTRRRTGSRPARRTRRHDPPETDCHHDLEQGGSANPVIRSQLAPPPLRTRSDHRNHETRNDPDRTTDRRPGMEPGRRPNLTRLSSYFTGNGGAAATLRSVMEAHMGKAPRTMQ